MKLAHCTLPKVGQELDKTWTKGGQKVDKWTKNGQDVKKTDNMNKMWTKCGQKQT